MTPVVVFDLDNTVVDFALGYSTLANKIFGTPIIGADQQASWDLDESFGLTEAQAAQLWDSVQKHDRFWAELPAFSRLEMQRIAELASVADVYFVTMRSGFNVKGQSEEWLVEHGIKHPSVIVTRGGRLKGLLALSIGATHLLEDNVGIAQAVAQDSPDTETFLIKRPYNRGGAAGVRHVTSVNEYLALIMEPKPVA